MLTHAIELEWIRFIHEFRSPFLDAFFKFLNFFDRREFFFVLIPAVWFGSGWKSGIKLFYTILACSLVNHLLKELFTEPRPYFLDPSLAVLQIKGYGFPSGAAQSVILLSGMLLSWKKNGWTLSIAILYISLISFSRIYLGAHFLSDVIAGWFVGYGLFYFYKRFHLKIENLFQTIPLFASTSLSVLIPLALAFWKPSESIGNVAFIGVGMGIGLSINALCQFDVPLPKNKAACLARALFAICSIFLFFNYSSKIYLTQPSVAAFLRFLLVGLLVSFALPQLYRLKERPSQSL